MRTQSLATPVLFLSIAFAFLSAGSRAQAANVIVNGGFETGTFAGWTTMDEAGSNGHWYIQSGNKTPQSGQMVVPPPGGIYAAMSDMNAPGSHVLYQDIVVPANVTSATLSFDRYRHNTAAVWAPGATLDFTIKPNQQCRVDFITTTANPFSLLPADVLLNIFHTTVTDPFIDAAYVPQTVDVTSFLAAYGGQTLRLRFAETDDQGIFQFAVDNVVLDIVSGGAAGSGSEGSFAGIGDPPGVGLSGSEGSFGSGGHLAAAVAPSTAGLLGPFLLSPSGVNGAGYGPFNMVSPPPTGAEMTVYNVSYHEATGQSALAPAASVAHIAVVGGVLVALVGVAVVGTTKRLFGA